MISSVIIKGVVGDKINENYREISFTDDVALSSHRECIVSHIPILYWTRDAHNALNNISNGSVILIKGHIESDIDIGLYVLAEYFEVIYENKKRI